MGTLEYIAPEQITGGALDERSDVGLSLGCVLYECLAGQSPFPRATDVALLWAHVHEEPDPPSRLRAELPRALDSVLARALAKEPGVATARPASWRSLPARRSGWPRGAAQASTCRAGS